jgi:cytochrome c-type biogenesis protein
VSIDLAGTYAAGLLTFVTPCVLPLIPVYLAMLMGGAVPGEQPTGLRARLGLLLSTALFSLGFIIVFVVMGLTATSLGALITAHRDKLVLLGGLLIFLFGLKFLGVLKIGWLERDTRLDDRKLQTRFRSLNALLMGLVFALGWTPCVGPILGSVLTYTASATSDPLTGGAYLGAYGLGFATPLLVLALFADAARKLVGRISKWLPKLEKVTGVLLMVVGLVLMMDISSPPAATRSPTPVASSGVNIDPALGQPTPRPRMVEFVSPSCSICRQMIPTVALVKRDCGGKDVEVVEVDVDHSQNQKLARDFRVRGVPTFVFLDAKGQELARLVGYQTLGALQQGLSTVVGGECEGVGSFKPVADECSTGPGARCDNS